MRLSVALAIPCSFALAALASAAGCSGATAAFGPGADSGAGGALCGLCTTSADCNGGVCAQFQGDSFCAPACPNGDECSSDRTCSPETTVAGDQTSVCVPNNNACGKSVGPALDAGPPGCDAGTPVDSGNTCGSLVGPTTPAQCHSCGSGGNTCQPNGCYGGWWCDTSMSKCHAPPANCSGGGGTGGTGGSCGGGTIDAGPVGPVTGTVGPTGGTVSRLYFTAVGDTRPSSPTSSSSPTAGYPTQIIDQIYTDIAAMNPQPLFSVSTGDYMFATPSSGTAGPQLDLYLQARAKFPGVFFPAMGNHECTGATASNCGANNTDGVTDNMTQFLTKMLGPIQQTSVYYSVNVNATDGSWTSKFVFVAANAWDAGQASWLQGVMAKKTTYTFVLRHESSSTSGTPGVGPSDQIIGQFPYTLLIVGHSHTYGHPSTQEVLFGNGGAPISGSANYGYGLFSQRQDGAIVVDAIDYQSNQPDASFHFVITPAGALTQ